MDEIQYWLALLHAPGIGPVGFQRLIAAADGSIRRLFEHPPSQCPSALQTYLRAPDWATVERDLTWAGAPQRSILMLDDPRYPRRLAAIADPPPLLFVEGDCSLLDSLQLAMVGSRNPTPTGAEIAHDFARHLAGTGVTITSGLALGVDAAAHRGCMDGGGQTIAVSGTGLDRVYPASHRDLARMILDTGGTVVSEFPPGTPPLPAHFPRRNRIISGLSVGTLVIEAALRSGSLITARTAAEQGREVFAIPGSIHNPLSRGCHRLIREGAKLVETAADILEELAPQLRATLNAFEPTGCENELTRAQIGLLNNLDHTPVPVDVVVERSGLTAEVVSSMLLVLELQGYVAAMPGGRYSRTSKRV